MEPPPYFFFKSSQQNKNEELSKQNMAKEDKMTEDEKNMFYKIIEEELKKSSKITPESWNIILNKTIEADLFFNVPVFQKWSQIKKNLKLKMKRKGPRFNNSDFKLFEMVHLQGGFNSKFFILP